MSESVKREAKPKEAPKADAPTPATGGGPKPQAGNYRGRIYDNILQTIGGTPLVRVPKLTEKYGLQADLVLKLEFFNPLGSVKDRIALAMIETAEREGKIKPGKTILVEPTSGNTGIGLAFVAAFKGYKLILTMPESMSLERQRMLKHLGAELILIAPEKGMKGAITAAEQYLKESKDYFMLRQFDNPANVKVHADTTAEEIWADTGGKADILISGVGTGGTITGVAQVLKKRKPGFKAYAVEPSDSPVLSGGEQGHHKIQGIGAGFVPAILDMKLVDGVIKVTNDQAFTAARELAKVEGIPGGISSGAAMAAAIEVAKLPDSKGKMIVTIIPSFAERYITTALFEGRK